MIISPSPSSQFSVMDHHSASNNKPTNKSNAMSIDSPPTNNVNNSTTTSSSSTNSPQHDASSQPPPPSTRPLKPSHSAKLALISVQNANYMGARTQINLCPPGKAREELLQILQTKQRRKKNAPTLSSSLTLNSGSSNNTSLNLSQPAPIRRSLSFQRASSVTTVGSMSIRSTAEELSFTNFEKIIGESGVAEYKHEEEKFLSNPNVLLNNKSSGNRRKSTGSTSSSVTGGGAGNADEDEIQEDPSSGDEDELDYLLFDDEDSPMLQDDRDANSDKDYPVTEPLYLCGTEAVSEIRGSANSGKIAFNFRKLKWFDSITATDRATARQFLKKEIANLKKRDVKALTSHLKKVQRREKRRREIEQGRSRSRIGSETDRLLMEEEDDDESMYHQFSGIGKLPSPMTPSLSAALVLESLSLNPLESIEGMAKCYEGIVAAGSALLDSKIDDPTSTDKKKHSKEEIVNALAPLLITTLEKASGDTILALAKLRKSCGTKRYQRRFIQRIAPHLIRPPNAAMWCLRHQQDMESILAAAELILDKSSEIFHKEWYEHGRTILADSKRAETLKAAAMQLKSLSAQQPSDRLIKAGLSSKKGGVNHRRSRSGSFFKASMDGSGSGNEVMAEWEILAVDQQIRDSIHNLFTKDWRRVVVSNAPPRDGEPQSKKLRGITAGKSSKSSVNEIDTLSASSSNDQSQYVNSPPRLSHHNRMLPSNNSGPLSSSSGPRSSSSSAQDYSSEQKNEFQKPDLYDPSTPPHTPRNNENEVPNTPPRSPPHAPSYNLSPRNNPLSPNKFIDTTNTGPGSSMDARSSSPAPLSPVNSYRRQQDSGHQRFTSNATGSSPSAQSKYLRTLTSTAAERKRTVAACRALRAQIARFEDSFIKMHGRPPKGAAERAPLATTYAQYREWKRAIRADAASRIQALARGARVRSYLSQEPRFRDIVRRKAGRPKKVIYPHLSMPENMNKSSKMHSQPIAPMPRKDDSVEIVMGPPSSTWSKRSITDQSHDSSTFNASQFTRNSGSVNSVNTFKFEIAHLSLPELQTQKRELKQELKKYDMNFYNQHGRMPVKAEKEPIRHLYEKYNQLKNRITAVERDPSLIQQSVPGPRRKQTLNLTSPSESSNNSNTTTESQPSHHSLLNHSRPEPSYGRHAPVPGPTTTPDLAALKTEKQALHQMLRSYEKEFYKKYNRQVSSYADIRPVASQYRRYKDIKKSIAALQSAVGEN